MKPDAPHSDHWPDWSPQPAAAGWMTCRLEEYCAWLPAIETLQARLLTETGTRLLDWVDHLQLPATDELAEQLATFGFQSDETGTVWQHPLALLPRVRTVSNDERRLAIRVERVAEFLLAAGLDDGTPIAGAPWDSIRQACVATDGVTSLWAIERHGDRRFEPAGLPRETAAALQHHYQSFLLRRRDLATDAEGFEDVAQRFTAAAEELGTDRSCDLFFATERIYWQRRNRAARVQKARQDQLGLGWANHDHHTYRSSRENFVRLVGLLEQMGFRCRERFYAGREAGWGAQVLFQPATELVVFADVDLSPDEASGDFAHQGLMPHDTLGTIGLWCKLHGDAMLQAGLHHLECQFDFTAAGHQLAAAGVDTMEPFTWLEHLKQAFTTGERWPVAEHRLVLAVESGWITTDEAQQFRTAGAIGSHLEILERNDGYQGFNQTGISDIIRKTDPRGLNS